ncbi:MAG: hypothetical protein ACKV2V_17880 [Blastocatellia bacterium]
MNQPVHSLEIYAQLAVSVAGHEFSVQSDAGTGIRIELPNLSAGWTLFRQRPARRLRATLLNQLAAGLLACGSRLEIRLAGRTVAALGTGNSAGLTSAMLGLRPLQLFPAQIILAWRNNLSR